MEIGALIFLLHHTQAFYCSTPRMSVCILKRIWHSWLYERRLKKRAQRRNFFYKKMKIEILLLFLWTLSSQQQFAISIILQTNPHLRGDRTNPDRIKSHPSFPTPNTIIILNSIQTSLDPSFFFKKKKYKKQVLTPQPPADAKQRTIDESEEKERGDGFVLLRQSFLLFWSLSLLSPLFLLAKEKDRIKWCVDYLKAAADVTQVSSKSWLRFH